MCTILWTLSSLCSEEEERQDRQERLVAPLSYESVILVWHLEVLQFASWLSYSGFNLEEPLFIPRVVYVVSPHNFLHSSFFCIKIQIATLCMRKYKTHDALQLSPIEANTIAPCL